MAVEEVGSQSFEQRQCLCAVGSFGHNLESESLQVMPNDVSNKEGIIRYQHTQSHRLTLPRPASHRGALVIAVV